MTVLGLMSNSELLRIKNRQKTPYKKQNPSKQSLNNSINGLMTDSGLRLGTKDKTKRKQKEGKYGIKKLT